ncbi:MAG TPA: iron ABC transporter permease [Edaphocola sp.]|nr:iron ABC transporter permease [Edaphocola sp.]
MLGGILLFIIVFMLSLTMGAYQFEDKTLSSLWLKVFTNPNDLSKGDYYVIFSIRLPRVIMGSLIGSALALSGTALQGMFKNPLATPSLIGVNSGASLFAAVAIVIGAGWRSFLPDYLQYSLISIMAFLGAILTMTIVYRVSTTQKKTNVVIMLLAGVAISALAGAVTGFLTYLTNDEELRNLTFWTLGSLGGATWTKNSILLLVILISFIILLPKGKVLNALMLGDKDAAHLGIPVEKTKKQIIFLTALMVGVSVAFAGAIGFVGLIVPYILRLIFKSDYNFILPSSAIFGSILLVLADTISRTIVAPAELPIGILTASLGAPVFIAILIRYKKSF